MNKRFWHGLNKESNVFGFGCWQLAGNHYLNGIPNGWGNVNKNQAIDLLSYAIENGIDFYDTAQGYNLGQSERLLGEAVKQTGKQIIVCTKIALSEKEIYENKIGVDFKSRVFQSLENLSVPCIDMLLIHNPPDDLNWKAFDYDIFQDLIDEKIIGTYGVSSKSLKGAKSVIENNVGTTVEWVFNIFERRPVADLFQALKARKMNFIARSPLCRGLINPKYIKNNPSFYSDDFRTTLPDEWIHWVISTLKTYHLNGVPESTLIENALLFVTQFKEVNACIAGIKSKNQLEQYLAVSRKTASVFNIDHLRNIPEFYPKWA